MVEGSCYFVLWFRSFDLVLRVVGWFWDSWVVFLFVVKEFFSCRSRIRFSGDGVRSFRLWVSRYVLIVYFFVSSCVGLSKY